MRKKRVGRRPLPAHERRSVTMTFRTTPEKSALIRRAARLRDKSVTDWMRSTLMRSATRIVEGG